MNNEIKNRIDAIVDALKPELRELAFTIHENPELGGCEFKARDWQVELLKKYGFETEIEYLGIPTAYKASYIGRKPGPKIAMLAEYDALPGIGHACGHNLICTMSVGSGIAMREFADEFGGEIYVIGTPAEETSGAKVPMSRTHAFDDFDVVMMAHPGHMDADAENTNAIKCFSVEFFGKAAHAAASPTEGVNALDAMISLFVSAGLMRQQVADGARIHGIITHGGEAPNIIPAYTRALFYTRAEKFSYALKLAEWIYDAAKGAALATGCTYAIHDEEEDFMDTRTNEYLADMTATNLEKYWGHTVFRTNGLRSPGGSDLGNVSYCCPSVQMTAGLSAPGVNEFYALHTEEFARRAHTEQAITNCMDFIRTFTATAYDLMTDPSHLEKIREEFSHIND